MYDVAVVGVRRGEPRTASRFARKRYRGMVIDKAAALR
jgi:hypothetical protein